MGSSRNISDEANRPRKQSSEELSSLAARVLQIPEAKEGAHIMAVGYNDLLAHAKRLAGSVLAQDETTEEDDKPHPSGLDISDLPGGIFDNRDA